MTPERAKDRVRQAARAEVVAFDQPFGGSAALAVGACLVGGRPFAPVSLFARPLGEHDWDPIGRAASPARIGRLLEVDSDSLTVELWHDGELEGASPARVGAGKSLAAVGGEVIGFGDVEELRPSVWRLGALSRGAHGTEAAVEAHEPGEPFIVLDGAPVLVPYEPDDVGLTWEVVGVAPGSTPDRTRFPFRVELGGAGATPMAPKDARATWDGPTLFLEWEHRSRIGRRIEARTVEVQDEPHERWEVEVEGPGGTVAFQTEAAALAVPILTIPALVSGVTEARIRRIGSWLPGRVRRLPVPPR